MQLINSPTSLETLRELASSLFGDMVKAVVDVERKIMVVNGELHADEEQLLLSQGSQQQHLWGINLYPDLYGDEDWIEFDSMINLRPSGGNTSRGVDDPEIQEQIRAVVHKLVTE